MRNVFEQAIYGIDNQSGLKYSQRYSNLLLIKETQIGDASETDQIVPGVGWDRCVFRKPQALLMGK